MSCDLISIITPVYNDAKWLALAENSVIHQSHTKWEWLLVDDGSEPETAIFMKEISDSDERIKLLSHAQNMGVACARNHAIAKAQGRYIAFIDADDVWHPRKLELQLVAMKNNPKAVFSCTAHYKLNFHIRTKGHQTKGHQTKRHQTKGHKNNSYQKPDLKKIFLLFHKSFANQNSLIFNKVPAQIKLKHLLGKNPIANSSVLFDRDKSPLITIANIATRSDLATWISLLKEDNALAIGLPRPLTTIVRRNQSLSSSKYGLLPNQWRALRMNGLGVLTTTISMVRYCLSGILQEWAFFVGMRDPRKKGRALRFKQWQPPSKTNPKN